MNLPAEFFSTPLTPTEFKVIVSLYHLEGPRRLVEATTEELSILTQLSPESLRRAFRGLEKAGLLETLRTKRNGGKWSKNKYRIVPSHKSVEKDSQPSHESVGWTPIPSHKSVGWSAPPSHKSVGSTHGTTWLRDSYLTVNSQVSVKENTTYFLRDTKGVSRMKEVNMEKWRPQGEDTTGDDNIGGVGLFADEIPSIQKPHLSVNKRDVRTRGRRPQSEWTTYDVAAEFQFRLGVRFPYIPHLINVKDVAGALRGYRSKFDTTADLEMEIMDMFFEDDRNLKNADQNARHIHTRYLSMFKTHMTRAYERLGIDTPTFASESKAQTDYVYASDGKKFMNSLLGRKRLQQYEDGLKGN